MQDPLCYTLSILPWLGNYTICLNRHFNRYITSMYKDMCILSVGIEDTDPSFTRWCKLHTICSKGDRSIDSLFISSFNHRGGDIEVTLFLLTQGVSTQLINNRLMYVRHHYPHLFYRYVSLGYMHSHLKITSSIGLQLLRTCPEDVVVEEGEVISPRWCRERTLTLMKKGQYNLVTRYCISPHPSERSDGVPGTRTRYYDVEEIRDILEDKRNSLFVSERREWKRLLGIPEEAPTQIPAPVPVGVAVGVKGEGYSIYSVLLVVIVGYILYLCTYMV
jgi:hypothetical protein